MQIRSKKLWLAATAIGATLLALPALSHLVEDEMPQSYRQSYFALIAANFGPMGATVKGEIPWDQTQMENYANDLAALSSLNVMRGFVDGSDKGTTRARPEIWENKPDFISKMDDLHAALVKLQEVTVTGDRAAIAKQVGEAGKACKACHDDYKSKNYLY
ncbi:MAG: cytochrome c [Pseudomonadota bacterium]